MMNRLVVSILCGLVIAWLSWLSAAVTDKVSREDHYRTEDKIVERIEKLEESHLQMIPTWPDYIELEKDIYFDIHDQNAPDGMWKKVRWPLPKGTKIYFKD